MGVKDVFIWNNACMMKHLWDLARKKDSLWVKWCHMFMLRGKNLWNCSCGIDASWTWRKLMKLRHLVVGFIRYVIGNGNEVWFWHDNWHPMGPIFQRFGSRVVYDATSRHDARAKDFINQNEWRLPAHVSNDLVVIARNMPSYDPNINSVDIIEWVLTPNKQFTIRFAWNAMRTQHPVVSWHTVVWHKDSLPRCSFILWLVYRNGINTRDKLVQWGSVADDTCVMCGDAVETRDHLFFACPAVQNVWKTVLTRLGTAYICNSWEQELEEAVNRFKGSSLFARLGSCCFAITVYCIWQERKQCIFQRRYRT